MTTEEMIEMIEAAFSLAPFFEVVSLPADAVLPSFAVPETLEIEEHAPAEIGAAFQLTQEGANPVPGEEETSTALSQMEWDWAAVETWVSSDPLFAKTAAKIVPARESDWGEDTDTSIDLPVADFLSPGIADVDFGDAVLDGNSQSLTGARDSSLPQNGRGNAASRQEDAVKRDQSRNMIDLQVQGDTKESVDLDQLIALLKYRLAEEFASQTDLNYTF